MIRVLIVEDDPMVAEFNKMYLERVEGFRWLGTAASVEGARRVLIEEKLEADLILLDIYMQKNNGLDLLPIIREIDRNMDVIVISAASDIQTVNKALRYGAVDYLIKPFQFSRFCEALTAYRQKMELQKNRQYWNQDELDSLIKSGRPASAASKLPKGLTRQTLQGLWEWIQTQQAPYFSTEEASTAIHVSRVSTRKYLMFLEELGVLDADILYGTAGRPVNIYKPVPGRNNLVEQFLK